MSVDNVRPFQKPQRAPGIQPPSTAGRNPDEPRLRLSDRHTPASPSEATNLSGYARTDTANDFNGHDQANMRLVGFSEAQWEGASGAISELDVAAYSVFVITLNSSKTFTLAEPPAPYGDFDEQPKRRAWGMTVYITYGGDFEPNFSGATWGEEGEPEWTSEAGKIDVIVLTYISGRWFGFVGDMGFDP